VPDLKENGSCRKLIRDIVSKFMNKKK